MALPWFKDSFPLYLAPMAGVTNTAFRQICKEYGADVMVSEFVSSEGILQQNDRTRKYTKFSKKERPIGIQIFGADEKRMAISAKKLVDDIDPDFIDINFGCPVKKVVSKNGGSSLLKKPLQIAKIISHIAKEIDPKPLTAKIRIGWNNDEINALEISKIIEESGAKAIAIHGRTRTQGYSGYANWDVIAECASCRKIPIIANGDIDSGQIALEKRKKYPEISGFMIGRGAMSRPWIFREIRESFKLGKPINLSLDCEERWKVIINHAKLTLNENLYSDERHALMSMRRVLMSYSRGFKRGKFLREHFSKVESLEELKEIQEKYNKIALLYSKDK